MTIKAMELHLGSYILLNGKIWKVTDKTHVKPGKGGAYLQVILKSTDGTKLDHRFSSSDTVETVMMEKKKFEFSYIEKNIVVLSNRDTYETIEIMDGQIPEQSMFLLKRFGEGEEITLELADDVVIDATLPVSIKVKVDFADPVVKGQTAASSYKTAIIKQDIKIGVPPYVAANDMIIINLYGEKGIEFVSRA